MHVETGEKLETATAGEKRETAGEKRETRNGKRQERKGKLEKCTTGPPYFANHWIIPSTEHNHLQVPHQH